MNKFDSTTLTLASLTKGKKTSCATALSNQFVIGQTQGLGNREAFHFAMLTHAIEDHGANENAPELTFEPTDENARVALDEAVEHDRTEGNEDGLADERGALVLKWYELFRNWGASVPVAFAACVSAAEDEWYEGHDVDLFEAHSLLNSYPGDPNNPDHEAIKKAMWDGFNTAREEGETIFSSLAAAKEAGQEALEEIEARAFVAMLTNLSRRNLAN